MANATANATAMADASLNHRRLATTQHVRCGYRPQRIGKTSSTARSAAATASPLVWLCLSGSYNADATIMPIDGQVYLG